jgi:phosphatidylserine/phosphatidylglycerophosphate/cardiolipin synthase-like enzyme
VGVNLVRRLLDSLRPTPRSPEDLAAEAESKRIQDQNLDVRLSQRSGAGENYQSGRGSH